MLDALHQQQLCCWRIAFEFTDFKLPYAVFGAEAATQACDQVVDGAL